MYDGLLFRTPDPTVHYCIGHAAIATVHRHAYTPAGVTLHWLRPIACQPITIGQAAALVANERTPGLLTANERSMHDERRFMIGLSISVFLNLEQLCFAL